MEGYDERSLIMGRFQPFHNGHLEVIRRCVAESTDIVIGIGSAQYSHEADNPFTAGERHLMIDEALREEGLRNYCIVPIEDLNRYSVWVPHVVSMTPPFKRVYSNNPLTRRLFSEAGFELRESPLYSRDVYSGTVVRQRMVEGGEWRPLVPPAVARVIDRMGGVERLREITGRE
ncbi:MAG: nicotinamide-nucleotide adenylyltransferase [Euryarchaeota archaeon]|nr:nicotinamide-nucleotide adenylyltransferase [Euryarchaeota archaeon]